MVNPQCKPGEKVCGDCDGEGYGKPGNAHADDGRCKTCEGIGRLCSDCSSPHPFCECS